MVAAVDRAAHARLANTPPEHFAANRTTGSMLDIVGDPTFDALVAHPSVIDLLERLGFGHEIVFSAGYVISNARSFALSERRRQWLATIGVDILAFSGLHVLEVGTSFNYAALLVLLGRDVVAWQDLPQLHEHARAA